MKRKRKIKTKIKGWIIFIIIIIVLIIGLFLIINNLIKAKDKEYPVLNLKGDLKITLTLNQEFIDPGYKASDNKD